MVAVCLVPAIPDPPMTFTMAPTSTPPLDEQPVDIPTPSPVAPDEQPGDGPTPSPVTPTTPVTPGGGGCTACDEADQILTDADLEAMAVDGMMLVCNPDCAVVESLVGCGAFGLPIECQIVYADDDGDDDDDTGMGGPIGNDGDDDDIGGGPTGSCTAAEETACADLSPAQLGALSRYDNGGKRIVCDQMCVDGDDPSHCNCECVIFFSPLVQLCECW